MEDIASYLQGKGCDVKAGGGDNIHTHCFFCDEEPEKKGRLYINVSEGESHGLFYCFLCGEKGGYNKIRQHFGDEPISINWGLDVPHNYLDILEVATDYYAEQLTHNADIYRYLREDRALTLQTIKNARLGWAAGGLATHLVQRHFDHDDIVRSGLVNEDGSDFLYKRITFPYMVMGQVVLIRGRISPEVTTGQKYLQPKGIDLDHLYCSDRALNTDRLVVCEGEIDTLTLNQLGFNAVGVPGVQTWKPDWTEHIEGAKRIFICFDNDKAGRAGAETTAQKIGPKTRIVEMPESLPGQKKVDVNEFVAGQGKNADDFHFLFSRSIGGMLVSPLQAMEKYLEIENNPGKPRLRLGIPALDSRMEKGLGPGAVWITTARTGSGKSLGSLNMFHRISMIQPHVKILYVSMEQGRNEWFESAHRIHKFYEPDAEFMDTVEYWSDKLFVVDRNRLTADELQGCVQQMKYEMGDFDLVCVDYLGYFAQSYKGSPYEKVSAAVLDLKRIAREEEVVVSAPTQTGRKGEYGEAPDAGSAKDSGAVEETADLEMVLWNEDQKKNVSISELTGLVGLEIKKARNMGGNNTRAMCKFSYLSRVLVPVEETERIAKVDLEREWYFAGVNWEEACKRHKMGNNSAFFGLKN